MRWLLANPLRPYVLLAAAASLLLNLALLIPSIYMLQIFDRVFASRSAETLLMLTLLALLALLLGYFIDSVRAESLGWAGRALDRFLSPRALATSLQFAAANTGRSDNGSLRDIASLRGFLSSNGVLALFDAPWLPVYLLVIAALHPLLGITATAGAGLLTALAITTEKLTRTKTEAAHWSARATTEFAQIATRNAEVIVGMGMVGRAIEVWRERHESLMQSQENLGRTSARLASLARMARQGLQISMLALGAWLVIGTQSSPGIMIAATILLGRALQPVEQLISGWKTLIEARAAWSRLSRCEIAVSHCTTELPAPSGKFSSLDSGPF